MNDRIAAPLLGLALCAAGSALAQAPPDTTHLLPALAQPAGATSAVGAALSTQPAGPARPAHRLPFAAERVELRLAVANRGGADARGVAVVVERSPEWIAFRSPETSAGLVGAGAVGASTLVFDVSPDAPVGVPGHVVIQTSSEGGEPTARTLSFVVAAPEAVQLLPPSPNPASRRSRIAFDLPAQGRVDLRVYDTLGRQVAVLIDGGDLGPGRHETVWEAGRAASGLYIYRLTYDGPGGAESVVGRLTIAK